MKTAIRAALWGTAGTAAKTALKTAVGAGTKPVRHKIATAVIREYQHKPPVDVVGIAERLGIDLIPEALGEHIAGKLIRDSEPGGSAHYTIIVNSADHPRRRRFTIAHELAHFVLHRDLIEHEDVVDNELYRSHLSNYLEAQANRLAANILMPYPLITELRQQGILAPLDLARKFNVSEQAMRIRLGRTEAATAAS